MKPALVERPEFQDEVKRLSRKYRHIENDLQNFFTRSFSPRLWFGHLRFPVLNAGCGRSG